MEDGYQRGALTAVRSLGRSSVEVGVASPVKGHAARSRHCARWHEVVSPTAGGSDFVSGLRSALAAEYDVVLAAGDAELMALSLARESLGSAVRLPDHEVVRAVLDRERWKEGAAASGLGLPREVSEDGPAFPVVVKEAVHGGEVGQAPRHEVMVVDNEGEMRAVIEKIRSEGGTPLLQEVVRGPLKAVVLVLDRDGRVVAAAQQEALRLWPPRAGVSAYARTVRVDRGLADRCADMLRTLRWWGIAELQFLTGPGGDVLIDVNPRIYGSCALATAAGADVTGAWAAVCMEREVPYMEARSGVRYQWLEGDLRRASSSGEKRGRDILRTLAAAVGSHHSMWSFSDPVPTLAFAATLARRARKRPWN